MSPLLQKYRHPNERLYGLLLSLFGGVAWFFVIVLLLVSVLHDRHGLGALALFAFYGVMIYLVSVVLAAFYRAYAMGHMVALSEQQFPALYADFVSVSRELGLTETPKAFIYNSGGVMNAFAVRLLRGRYVFLTSAIVEADEDTQLRFIMAHEIAHHALGHLNTFKHFLRMPAALVPFLYRAYSRAREYSCDAIGASVVPDINHALSALQMLACGAKRLNAEMNIEAFAAQEMRVPGLAGFFVEIMSTHPRLTRRVAYLRAHFPQRAV